MPETVTVKSFSGGSPWKDLIYYDCVFDRNGSEFKASWGKKGAGEPPVGESIEGEFYEKNGEWKFRKASKPPGGGGGTSSSGGGDYQRQSGGGKSADQQASIVRQHSQEMALRALTLPAATAHWDGHPLDHELKRAIEAWTNFFEADANAAQTATGAGGTVSPAGPVAAGSAPAGVSGPPTPPQASDKQGVHELLTELFVKAGEAGPIATLLTGWVIETQAVEKQDKALAALREPESAAVVVKWAREGYEAKHGPLPGVSTDIDDDIPFARPEYGEVFSERERHSNRP